MITLYSYYRSSAAYRVRIALALKQLDYQIQSVHLLRSGGEHRQPHYLSLNPQGLVPTLVDGEVVLPQSIAILEYLEEKYPQPALLPSNLADRARVRGIMQLIASDTHPLNNLRVLKYLQNQAGLSEEAKNTWYRHWIHESFMALETMLAKDERTGEFCHGNTPSLADCCLVPQVFNARRFQCDLTDFPTIVRIDAACQQLTAFEQASPQHHPDSEA